MLKPTPYCCTISLTLTLTFDLSTPNRVISTLGYPAVIPYTKFEHCDHFFLSYAAGKQIDNCLDVISVSKVLPRRLTNSAWVIIKNSIKLYWIDDNSSCFCKVQRHQTRSCYKYFTFTFTVKICISKVCFSIRLKRNSYKNTVISITAICAVVKI